MNSIATQTTRRHAYFLLSVPEVFKEMSSGCMWQFSLPRWMKLSITRETEPKIQRKPRLETGLVLLCELSGVVGPKLIAHLSVLATQAGRFLFSLSLFRERRLPQFELDPCLLPWESQLAQPVYQMYKDWWWCLRGNIFNTFVYPGVGHMSSTAYIQKSGDTMREDSVLSSPVCFPGIGLRLSGIQQAPLSSKPYDWCSRVRADVTVPDAGQIHERATGRGPVFLKFIFMLSVYKIFILF